MVDLNLEDLYARQLSPIDVSNALNLQNLILPAGTAKLANTEYQVKVNSSPLKLADLNNLPIKTVNGATVYLKDVAQVRDGFNPRETYEDGYVVNCILDAGYQSMHGKKWVRVKY